jgi:uncharacterized peroxidase-related enzyme
MNRPDPGGALMSPARLPLIERDQAGMLVRRLYPEDGDASNVTKALAGSPDTLAAMAPFLAQVMNATTVDLPTKEVVVLRVSAMNRCAYCVPTHEVVARASGLDADVVVALASTEPPDERLPPRIRILAEFCDRLVADANQVPDSLLTAIREHFEDHEIVELTVLAGAITTLNYVASLAGLPLDATTLAAR